MDSITMPDWSSLPESLLNLISKNLNTRIDILRYRSVCNSFRASTPLPPKFSSPYASLKIPIPDGLKGDHLLLTESTVYAIQPLNEAKTWLIKLQETNSCTLRIFDLFSAKRKVKHLSSHEFPPKSLNLLDYRVKEISKIYGYNNQVTGQLLCTFSNGCWIDLIVITKVVTSKCFDNMDDDFVVMALHQYKPIVWRIGDKSWNTIKFGDHDSSKVLDIIYHNGKFYAVDNTGLTVVVNSNTLCFTEIGPPIQNYKWDSIFFMESCNELFFIVVSVSYNCPYFTFTRNPKYGLKVFKLNEKMCGWDQVEEDRLVRSVFFVGDDCSFSISVKDLSGCEVNCVAFTGNHSTSFPKFVAIIKFTEAGKFRLKLF
ncbi:hypothetical protein Ddye_010387 [Dipteronia dyeriana]|uniref:KIB1-4 beta-propeller domain-containing protein n=1 Tax=Dipteronia dyeriana TaxID=168575 RepID=A0AAD9XDE4_9ROSI|nr:hypothetical protein Ddye_010387 [Dipteronia dyeriana]